MIVIGRRPNDVITYVPIITALIGGATTIAATYIATMRRDTRRTNTQDTLLETEDLDSHG
jgi:hypothetical protein